jgi:peptide/nickel transport system permease protein
MVAMAALTVLFLIVIAVLAGPWIYPTNPFAMVSVPFSPPGQDEFLFGTDYLGRDLLAQVLSGGRVTLLIGASAAVLTVVIGVCVGACAGFYGGLTDELLMRLTEVFQVLPTLLFTMVIVALFGASWPVIILAIGLASWTSVARITRTEFLRIRELEFVAASRLSGASNGFLMFKVIMPNALPPIIVHSTMMVGATILYETGLGFLGLADPDVMSWGQIIGSNRLYILDGSFLVTIPGFAIFFTVLSICIIGDGLNDAFRPKSGRQ